MPPPGRLASAAASLALAGLCVSQRRGQAAARLRPRRGEGAPPVPGPSRHGPGSFGLTALGAAGLAAAGLAALGSGRRRRACGRAPPALRAERQAAEREASAAMPPVLFAAIFLSLLGFTMTGPILPALRAHFGLTAKETGLITSAFPLGMFVAVILFPWLSDFVGRKRMLVVSYLGVGVGLGLQSFAVQHGLSYTTFLLLRMATGACAGASTVVKAYLADVTPPERLPQVMAYRESAATLAFIFGPLFGGLALAASSLTSILTIESLTSLSAGVLVLLFLEEVQPAPRKGQQGTSARSATGDFAEGCPIRFSRTCVVLATIMFVSWSYNFGQSFFDGFFPLLCAERFGLPPPVIGSTQTAMALTVFMVTVAFYSRVIARLGLTETAALGLLLIGGGMATVGLAGSWPVALLGVLLYAVGIPLFSPSVAALLSSCAPARRRGLVIGVDSAINAIGRVAAPWLVGAVYDGSPTRAFCLAGAVAVAGAVATQVGRRSLG